MTLPEAKGLVSYILDLAVWAVVILWLVSLSPLGRDDTDPGSWGKRSGFVPRVDHKTGCEYLEGGRGGITPRLTADGSHMGCKQ
jgi:hypothetical protein